MCRNQPKRFVQLVWVITIVRDNEMIHPLHFDTAPSNFSSRMSWIHCFNQFVFVAQPVPGANGAQSQWFGSYPATLHSPTCISFCHSKSEIFGSDSGCPWHRCSSYCYLVQSYIQRVGDGISWNSWVYFDKLEGNFYTYDRQWSALLRGDIVGSYYTCVQYTQYTTLHI